MGAAVLACTLSAESARANGKFPAADQLVVDRGDPTHIAARTTFGVLETRNAGADWHLVCESAIGYANVEPGIAMLPSGTLFTGLFDGVSRSSAGSCDWGFAAGLAGVNVPDVTASLAEPTVAIAIATAAGQSQYYESSDDAASFARVGSDLPASFAGLTVDVAPADPQRIYVSGLAVEMSGQVGRLARSNDRGQSWELVDVPGSDESHAPYIGAMHPTDPDKLYLRLDGSPGSLLYSDDGGDSWQTAWTAPSDTLRGLALSPDGETIVVGGEFDGLYRASTSDHTFTQLSALAVRCLTWTDEGLYACVNEFLFADGLLIGVSRDAGDSFETLLTLSCIRGPLECDDGSSVAATCPAEWPALAERFLSDQCGAGGSSGRAGAGGSAAPAPSDDGCGCRLAAPAPSGGLALLWLALGLLLRRRAR